MTAYPYNPEGNRVDCVIKNETHDIAQYYNPYKCIIPTYAPFFSNSLKLHIRETDGRLGRELLEGIDFYFGHKFEDASYQSGFPVFGSIFFINTNFNSDVTFKEYSTLGGNYNLASTTINEYLATDFDDPRNCKWTDIARHAIPVPPKYRPESLEEALEHDPVTKALHSCYTELVKASQSVATDYAELNTKMDALIGQIESWQILTHPDDHDHPHLETHTQINALGINESAKDTLKAYGRSLAELATLINSLGITQADLDHYVKLAGGDASKLSGELELGTDSAVILNHNGQTQIDLKSGNINLLVDRSINIKADTHKHSDKSAMLEAGHNVLSVESEGGTKSDRAFVYNGWFLVTVGNIVDFMPTLKPEQMSVTTQKTDTVELFGDGKPTNPLMGMVQFPVGSSSKRGILSVTDSLFLDSNDVALSSKVTHALNVELSSKLRTSQRLNNITLANDIVLTKNTFGLGNVENLSDKMLPNSDAFNRELTKKSDLDHKHALSDLGTLPRATTDARGLFRLYSMADHPNAVNQAVDGASVLALLDQLLEAEFGQQNKLPADMLDLYGVGDVRYPRISDNNRKLTYPLICVIRDGKVTYLKDVVVDIGSHFSHEGFARTKKVWLVVYRKDGSWAIGTGCAGADWGSLDTPMDIGYIEFTDSNGTTIKKNALENAYHLPATTEMINHFNDRNAHGLKNGKVSLETIGLDKINPSLTTPVTDINNILNNVGPNGVVTNKTFKELLAHIKASGGGDKEIKISTGEVIDPLNFIIPHPVGYTPDQLYYMVSIKALNNKQQIGTKAQHYYINLSENSQSRALIINNAFITAGDDGRYYLGKSSTPAIDRYKYDPYNPQAGSRMYGSLRLPDNYNTLRVDAAASNQAYGQWYLNHGYQMIISDNNPSRDFTEFGMNQRVGASVGGTIYYAGPVYLWPMGAGYKVQQYYRKMKMNRLGPLTLSWICIAVK